MATREKNQMNKSQMTKLAAAKKRLKAQQMHLETERRVMVEKLEQLCTIENPSERAMELKQTIEQALCQIDEELQNVQAEMAPAS